MYAWQLGGFMIICSRGKVVLEKCFGNVNVSFLAEVV